MRRCFAIRAWNFFQTAFTGPTYIQCNSQSSGGPLYYMQPRLDGAANLKNLNQSFLQKPLALVWCTVALLSFAPLAAETMTPSAPVKNFTLPMFGPDGYKIWDLQGREGIYINENHIDVRDMKLRTWTGRDPLVLDMTIESIFATIFPQDNRAIGEDFIYMTQAKGNFSVIGRNWEWLGDANKVIIKQDARVTFRESIGDILE